MRTKLQLKIKPKNVAMAHTRPRRKPKVEAPKSQWGAPNKKARRSTLYIRKIPISHQIEDIREQMRKCPGIPLKDLRVTQPLPNREFTGKWKYMSCVGPTTALETLTQACNKGSLPWKMNTAPPTRPTPFLDARRDMPHQGIARPEGPLKLLTTLSYPPHLSTHPLPPPHSMPPSFPPTHGSFVQGPPPPPRPWHQGPPSPPLAGLWHLLHAQGRELAGLRQCLGAPPPPPNLHWDQIVQ